MSEALKQICKELENRKSVLRSWKTIRVAVDVRASPLHHLSSAWLESMFLSFLNRWAGRLFHQLNKLRWFKFLAEKGPILVAAAVTEWSYREVAALTVHDHQNPSLCATFSLWDAWQTGLRPVSHPDLLLKKRSIDTPFLRGRVHSEPGLCALGGLINAMCFPRARRLHSHLCPPHWPLGYSGILNRQSAETPQ